MSGPVRVIGLVLGIVIVLGTGMSVFTTLVVPRASSSRLSRTVLRVFGGVVKPVVRRRRSYEAKDRVMAVIGPMGLVALFTIWISLIIVGFGLLMWWAGPFSLAHGLAISGSSVFTLGVLTSPVAGVEILEFICAGSGLLLAALVIAYLPALYQSYAQRETEVTLLAARAGNPAWGPEILARHHWFKTESELPDLWLTWERWAAGVAESHSNYPALVWFRSPNPSRSWLTALVAMMDASALADAVAPSATPRQARVSLFMGIRALRALADALHIPYDIDPLPSDPVRITYEEYMTGIRRLEQVDYPFERTAEEAWPHFRGWRVNYESMVDALTHLIMPPPAPWFLDRPSVGQIHRPAIVNRTPEDPQGRRPLIT